MKVKRTERGWAAHLIIADRCKFRRNTLLEYGDKKWIISTLGAYISPLTKVLEQIGCDRYYETMAFEADYNGEYIDAVINKPVDFNSPWGIFAESVEELMEKYPYADNNANDMHEAVVAELTKKIQED